MQLGMIGLGRMGANMVRRLMRGGHECVVYDVAPASGQALAKEGATGASSPDDFVKKLTKPRAAWVMVPLEHVEKTVLSVGERMELVLADAQTSGGLLMAVPAARRDALVSALRKAGELAAVIGEVREGGAGQIGVASKQSH